MRSCLFYLGLAILLVAGITANWLAEIAVVLVGIGAGTLVWAVAYGVVGPNMPQKTANGYDMYRRVLGYANFVSNATLHKDRLIHDKEVFETCLTYSLVFGVRKEMAQILEMMPNLPAPVWIKQR